MLVTKIRALNDTNVEQYKKAARATLILIPLLGLHYFIIPFRPKSGSPLLHVYLFTGAIITSTQGFFVTLIYCFLNGEVIACLKRKYYQRQVMKGRFNHTQVNVSVR